MDLSRLNDLISSHNTLYIAFSGGADSVCLAHRLATDQTLDPRIEKICLHVDHGLDPHSPKRALGAQKLAQSLGLPCELESMHLDTKQNIEATARSARYAFFKKKLKAGDVLVTAHHRDDVAETLMLRMLRGVGMVGLSGIEVNQAFGQGRLIRPLLDWSKAQIVDYLKGQQLDWIEDPTNEVMSIDRNFIRHEIMPHLLTRFPGAQEALNRSAALNRQGAELLAQTIAIQVANDQRDHQRLCIEEWPEKSTFEKAEMIRSWCLNKNITPPPGKPLESFVLQIAAPSPDRLPTLTWSEATLYCYRGHLWLSQVVGSSDDGGGSDNLQSYDLTWDGCKQLILPSGLGTLYLDLGKVMLDKPSCSTVYRVTSQRSLEHMPLGSSAKFVRTRKLLSEVHIPPWERAFWPRLWLGDQLLALGARWQAPELNNALRWETACFGAQANETGIS